MSDFETRLAHISRCIQILPDKPEETPESTLRALWMKAAGSPMSAERSLTVELPKLDTAQKKVLEVMIRRRLEGVPLGHLTGRQMFMGLELTVSPDALLPRRETEILGHAALTIAAELNGVRGTPLIVDTCCGSGNVALAVADQVSEVRVVGVDLSSEAVALAELNARNLGLSNRVEFRVGDLLKPVEDLVGKVDLITCNPPYISTASVATMDTEIAGHEPPMAFDGGPFGVKILRRLLKEAPAVLRPRGFLAFEVGLGQGEPMSERMRRLGVFDSIDVFNDASGAIRAIGARLA